MVNASNDRKKALNQGGLAGLLMAGVSWIFAFIFHKHLPIAVVAALPAVLGVAAHYLAGLVSPYQPGAQEVVSAVQEILNDLKEAE